MAELVRSFDYDRATGEPFMRLTTKRHRAAGNTPVCIRLQDAQLYSEGHNPNYIQFMCHTVATIIELLDLGLLTKSRFKQICVVIEDGLDDLVRMPPPRMDMKPVDGIEIDATMTVGNSQLKISGMRIEDEVFDIE